MRGNTHVRFGTAVQGNGTAAMPGQGGCRSAVSGIFSLRAITSLARVHDLGGDLLAGNGGVLVLGSLDSCGGKRVGAADLAMAQ